MKRLTLFFIIILVAVFFGLTFFDRHGQYEAEKNLWKINKEFSNMTKDPKSVPEGTYEDFFKRYQAFTKKFPNSNLVPFAQLHSGHTYMAREEYPKARKIFEDLIEKHPDKPGVGVQAAVEITRTYALEQDSDGVINGYYRVIRDFPLTDIGYKTPLLVVDFYEQNDQKALAKKALSDAVKHYNQIVKDEADTAYEMRARRMLASAYVRDGKPKKAVDELKVILLKFANESYMSRIVADNVLKSINTLSMTALQDYDLPIKIYTEFIEKYPNHRYTVDIKNLIKGFEILKEENVSVIVEDNEEK